MKERNTGKTTRRVFWMRALVALVLPVGVFALRYWSMLAAPQTALAATASPALPPLSTIKRHSGHATVSLDTIAINGKSTVVAGVTTRRTFRITRTDTVAFTGWAFDPNARAPAGGLDQRVGVRNSPTTYGLVRPDVAAAYKVPNLTLVGFNGRLRGRDLHPGANAISLIVISHDLKGYYINPSDIVLNLQ